jgi:hypothetical protein
VTSACIDFKCKECETGTVCIEERHLTATNPQQYHPVTDDIQVLTENRRTEPF